MIWLPYVAIFGWLNATCFDTPVPIFIHEVLANGGSCSLTLRG